jgi:translation initiation factor IF-2
LATVRIYKVAELLGTTSQEVMALLKRDHGIEVKSASSTIEEVVGRQFVERLARQRGVSLPSGDMFADRPAPSGKKPAPGKKAEPPKPQAPVLGPPRLIKTVKPAAPLHPEHEGEPDAPLEAADGYDPFEAVPVEGPPEVFAAEPEVVTAPEPEPAVPAALDTPPAAADVPVAATAATEADPEAAPTTAPPPIEVVPSEPPAPAVAVEDDVAAPVSEPAEPTQAAPAAHEPATPVAAQAPPPTAAPAAPTGRVVPPTRYLRIEESRPAAAPLTPQTPVRSVPTRPAAAPPARPATPAAARPAAPPVGARPVIRPDVARPSYQPTLPPGGPRPLPSHPVRPQPPGMARPGGTAGRPGFPSMPGRPPMGGRPPGGSRPSAQRRDHRREGPRAPASFAPAAPPPITRSITLAEGMTVKDLAEKLDVRVKDVLARLLMKRMMMNINSTLDSETAAMIAREFGAEVQMRTFEQELLQVESEDYKPEDLVPRAPVVTVMGHVDHGKTTLLDAIRSTRVAEREAGGITQHIGAYNVPLGDGRSIVFLDTPGHEAFTMMRARGAKVTDVVVLVVAADDGVMPQTREAVDHARAANVPIIVAVNKIDKAGANPDNVKRELAELGLVPEAWGGTTVMVDVSAKKNENLDLLLELILLVTDINEHKANPKRNAAGTVLEAKLDRGRGPVATILVQDGTLRVGDTFIAGTIVGKVRALIDDRGRSIKAAPPSTPVEVLGLGGLPSPGDAFQALADAAKARQIALFRQEQAKARQLGARSGRVTLESLQQQLAEGAKDLALIVKADVQGSTEVLADSLAKLSTDKVKIKIIRAGVGAINESDVLLASASEAIIIGFNVRPDRNAADLAERENVDIRHYSVIYTVTDEIKQAMEGLLEPTYREARIGTAEVRDLFKVPKFGTIAGCMVTSGRITRSGDVQARLLRDNVVVHQGRIGSLRRFKDDVSEVKTGFECGIGFDGYNDLKVGDVIECFAMERVAATA